MFKLVLKAATDSEFLIALGKILHNVKVATAKALSPYDFVLYLGTTSGLEISERKQRDGSQRVSRSDRYVGTRP